MSEVICEALIAKSREQVWAQLRDLRIARHYVTGASAIDYNAGPRGGLGASRRVHLRKGGYVDETVVTWQEGRGFTLNLHVCEQAPKPFKWAKFQYELTDAPNGQSLLRGVFSYEVGGGLIGRVFDSLLLRRAIQSSHAALGSRMQKFYERGEVSNPTAD